MKQDIPIKNIFYLLCYAWDLWKEFKDGFVGEEGIKELPDLLGLILAKGAKKQIRQGLERHYIETKEELPLIKGRLCIDESIRKQSFRTGKAISEYTELDYSTIQNRILKTTLNNILHFKNLDDSIRKEIHQATRLLKDIPDIKITNGNFRNLRFHRNNKFYEFLMAVCEMVHRNSMVSNNNDRWRFVDFDDEECLNRIFESYVRKFYQENNNGYQVKRTEIKWNLNPINKNNNYLPLMQTDVCIGSKNRLVVIEVKWQNATKSKYEYSALKMRTTNMYQIHSYLTNLSKHEPREIIGVLLYPKINESLDEWYKGEKYLLGVVTLDLNNDWQKIENQMNTLLEKSFNIC